MSEENTTPVSEEQTPENSAEEVMESIDDGNQEEVSENSEQISAEEATDEELEEVLDSEESTEEERAEAQEEMAKRLKLKIYGQEEEFDLGNDDHIERLKELAQKGEGADRRFQEAAALKKQMEQFAQLIQQDPLKALEAAGHDMEELSTKYLEQRINDMQKSPEQKRLEELEKEIEAERKKNESLQKAKQEEEQARAQEEYSRQLDTEITDALGSSELPKSPYVVKRIAENLMLAMDNGYEDVTVSDILPIVKKQIQGEIREMFEAMPEDVIEKTLGNNVSTKLRKRRLSRQKKVQTKATDVKQTGESEINKLKGTQKTKKMNAKDFFSKF